MLAFPGESAARREPPGPMDSSFLESLRNPDCYPERPALVELIQTHLSVVALAGDRVYKFKKPIRLPFADFSSLERRRHFCEEEVRLNRRLCPEIYESVVAWRKGGVADASDGDPSGVLDYAVKMRRLPQERMLDVLLAENAVRTTEIEAVARRVVAFHREAGRGPEVADWGDPERLRGFALANFEETRGAFPGPLHAVLEARTHRDFESILPLLRARAAAGRVVDGHGDLHARNICLVDPPAIYDCIEFNPSLRCGDVATEHAFLAMDLRFRGHPELARAYLDTVVAEGGDEEMTEVVGPLIRYRAMVRAKVSAIAAGETEIPLPEREEAAETARRYLQLAASSAVEDDGPRWVLCCGLPASGKSVVAAELSRASGGAWTVLSSDRIRKELAGAPSGLPLPPEFYAEAFSRRTYGELLDRALASSGPGRVVVLDANFRSRELRRRFRDAATEAGIACDLLQIELDEATALERLRVRAEAGGSESDADAAVYAKLKATFEAPTEDEGGRVLRISGSLEPALAAETVLAGLLTSALGNFTK